MPFTTLYRGRFAPTPSGPLHLGSLFTALASWLAARQAGGEWYLRIDDLDRPRCVAGAETQILHQLDAHGLHWDGAPVRQSMHEAEYHATLLQLDAQGWLYSCECTRAMLAASSRPGPDGPIYAGTCREGITSQGTATALRLRVPDGELQWQDGIQGLISRLLPSESGDFVLRRADAQIGYHLACALDEIRMGISSVVRGADLLGSTVHQRVLLQALGHPSPDYAHVPVLMAPDGRKLSKQNGAAALETSRTAVARQLLLCLKAMQLNPPDALQQESAPVILQWALPHWDARRLAGSTTLPAH